MSIIIIVLIAFITTNSLENNSKEKIITEPEVLGNDIYPNQTTLLRHIDCGDWILKEDGSKVQIL